MGLINIQIIIIQYRFECRYSNWKFFQGKFIGWLFVVLRFHLFLTPCSSSSRSSFLISIVFYSNYYKQIIFCMNLGYPISAMINTYSFKNCLILLKFLINKLLTPPTLFFSKALKSSLLFLIIFFMLLLLSPPTLIL